VPSLSAAVAAIAIVAGAVNALLFDGLVSDTVGTALGGGGGGGVPPAVVKEYTGPSACCCAAVLLTIFQ
jgi:hypothetical protein